MTRTLLDVTRREESIDTTLDVIRVTVPEIQAKNRYFTKFSRFREFSKMTIQFQAQTVDRNETRVVQYVIRHVEFDFDTFQMIRTTGAWEIRNFGKNPGFAKYIQILPRAGKREGKSELGNELSDKFWTCRNQFGMRRRGFDAAQ